MNRVTGLFLGFALAAQMAGAQSTSTTTHSLSIDVTVTGTGSANRAHSNFKENLGAVATSGAADQKDYSSSRKKESAVGLDVEVRNLAPTTDHPTVEWYFF